MSGREKTIFTFDPDDFTKGLINIVENQIESHLGKLASQIELLVLQSLSEELNSLPIDEARIKKTNLQKDISSIISVLSQFLKESLETQGEILDNYLKTQIFFVPPEAIVALNPLEIPIPVPEESEEIPINKKNAATDHTNEENQASLKEILLQVHKAEYFSAQLKKLFDENEAYIEVLQRILSSLNNLEEMIKSNDTEASIQKALSTLQSSWNSLQKIQIELQSRGISAGTNLPMST